MKLRRSFLGLALAFFFVTSTFATSTPISTVSTKDSKALKEIKSLIQKIDFDITDLDQKTVRVHFMVNTANEIVVLRTDNDSVDKTLKFGLNYRELENRDLEVNRVYILPLSFEAQT